MTRPNVTRQKLDGYFPPTPCVPKKKTKENKRTIPPKDWKDFASVTILASHVPSNSLAPLIVWMLLIQISHIIKCVEEEK